MRAVAFALALTVVSACGGGGGGGGGTDPQPVNRAPNAAAGADQSASVGSQVSLDGSRSSDPDGDPLTYRWSFSARPEGSAASLAGADTAAPRFTPDVGGRYTIMLTASDGRLQDSDSVIVDANTRPVAVAGTDQAVDAGSTVSLDASGSSDADGDAITFSWSLTRPVASQATLSDAASATPLFVADVPGAYVATLVVNDGVVDSAADSTTVTATEVNLNTPPTADAGTDASVEVGSVVTLDGTASTDADGDPLTFGWTLSTPQGSSAVLDDPASPTPSFTADVAGATYTATLVVSDGQANSAPDTVDFVVVPVPPNNLPVADAGAPQSAQAGALVQLDGSASSDPDGDPLIFDWSLAVPTGSSAALSDPTVVSPSFVADVAGVYTASLVVNDGQGNSPVDTVAVVVADPDVNTPPVAEAGTPITVEVGEQVVLDGGSSSDVDGDALAFSWILSTPAGSTAVLVGADSVDPAFTPDIAGVYTATLVVSDGAADSAPDSVVITVKTPQSNNPPVAHAGDDQAGHTGETVQLDGRSSEDLDGDALTFAWTLSSPGGSLAALDDPVSSTPSFVADKAGVYTATLIVSDGTDASTPDSATIVITDPQTNTRPIADPGEDRQVVQGERVTLDGRASSDVDGDPLTYSWSLSRPDGSQSALSDPTSPVPEFDADLSGLYAATLVVNDGELSSSPVTAVITATALPTNQQPVADADGDQSVQAGDLVQLDGTGSSDADGDELTYSWTLQAPAGSTAILSDAGAPAPTFTADVAGQYVATLIVNDGTQDSAADSAVVTATALPVNTPPVASAGGNQSLQTGEIAQLDGSGSTDADGDALTYAWTLEVPAGSTASLSDASAAAPSFVADVAGQYRATLIVNDGQADSVADLAVIDVTAPAANLPPAADAGADQAAQTGELVTLDGSGSVDADGDPLSYSWSLTPPAGSSSVLSDDSSQMPTFVPDVAGQYTATLIVSDGQVSSSPDGAVVTVSAPPQNTPPVADSGLDQAVDTGSPVTLDGSGSFDADGDALTFAWTLQRPAGSNAALSATDISMPVFTPDVAGQFVAVLIVNDGEQDSAPDTVLVTAAEPAGNELPVADAGADLSGEVGQAVTLDGSGSSDADGDALTFSWTLTRPTGSGSVLLDAASANPQFIPDLEGVYSAVLVVNDGKVDSLPDQVSVSVSAVNTPPVARAGPDASGLVGDLIVLDGAASSDADGDPLAFEWVLARPAGSAASLSDAAAMAPSFVADVAGTYSATLIVDDGTDRSAPDSATVSISEPQVNGRPLADAGADFSAPIGATARLDGAGSSDPDGDPLTYAWSLSRPAGSGAVLSDPAAVAPTFEIDLAGAYTATLVVSDGEDASAPDSVTVTAVNGRPSAAAGPDQSVNVGSVVVLDGGDSSDPEGSPVSYAWTLSRPAGSTATLSGADTVTPTFMADVAGIFTATLVVSDGTDDSLPDSVNILVNGTPVARAGDDVAIVPGNAVQLDGSSSSDPDGDALSYAWALSSPAGSAATLSSQSAAAPSFVADIAGVYSVTLTVSDGQAQDTDSLTVTANTPPTADAGPDQQATTGATVSLDGSGSADADGDALTYSWELQTPPASAAQLDDPTADGPVFTPDVGGLYTASLTVSDGSLQDLDSVTIDVNTIPVAGVGPDRAVDVGVQVVLDGSGSSDADGDALTYGWTLETPTGSGAVLSDPAAISPSFTPDVEGDYVASLVVDDGRDSSAAAVVTISASIPTMVVSGLVTFDRVGHAGNGGLDYTNIVAAPARGVVVEVVDDAQQVVANAVTDHQGRYSFELFLDLQVSVRVKARMQQTGAPAWDFPVIDNTNGGALYFIESPSFLTGPDDLVVDLHAPSGWDSSLGRYASARSAAPFAILDSIYQAVQLILGEDAATVFPPMDVNWSPLNRQSNVFEPEVGDIVTTAYNFDVGVQALFVLGDEDEDTDEYDGHVLVHEFAHYLEDRLGRTDSTGGSHTITARLDPRLAFSEGWANTFSVIVLGDPLYKDSRGVEQAGGFTFDVESNTTSNEGWYNESSVHSVLYDIYDQAADGLDSTAAGFGPLWEGVTGWHADSEALTSMFSLLPGLKSRLPADAANIDALLGAQSIEGPTMDIWASTETNSAGQGSGVLPIYTAVTVDDPTPVRVCTISQFGSFNRLSNRRFVTVDATVSGQHRITVTGPANSDPDIFLYRQGVLNSAEGLVEGLERLDTPLSPGRHVIEVYDACIVFGATGNPAVCPNLTPSETCLDVTVEAL